MAKGPIKILVADDDPEIRMAVDAALVGLAEQIFHAYDGQSAIDVVDAHPIAVAIIDLIMPGVGGVECLTRIREKSPTTACIMMSGMGQDRKVMTRCIELGALTFVTKPLELKLLQRMVESGISNYRDKNK
jgi:CheY-like chemotaxis protein